MAVNYCVSIVVMCRYNELCDCKLCDFQARVEYEEHVDGDCELCVVSLTSMPNDSHIASS